MNKHGRQQTEIYMPQTGRFWHVGKANESTEKQIKKTDLYNSAIRNVKPKDM
jgi:hypothetical protein